MNLYIKACLGLYFLSFSSSMMLAQDKLDDMDSLYQFLAGDISSQKRLEAVVDIAERFAFLNLDSAEHYISKGEQLLPEISDSTWIANTYLVSAKINFFKKEYELAKAYLDKCLNICLASHYDRGAEMAYDLKGSISDEQGRSDSAVFFYQQGLIYADSIGKAILMNNIGLIHVDRGEIEKAANYYMSAVEYIDKSYRYADYYLTSFYINIGILKKLQKDEHAAAEYFRMSIAAAENTGNHYKKALGCHSLGSLYIDLEAYDSAAFFLHEALSLSEASQNELVREESYVLLSQMHLTNTQPDSATYYLDLIDKNGDSFKKVSFKLGYLGASASLLMYTKKYPQAFNQIDQIIELAHKSKDALAITSAYELKSDCYEKSGDYREALNWHKKYLTLQDSISNLEYKKHLVTLEERYDTEKKEAEIATLSQQATIQALEIKQKNTGILIGVAVVVLVAGGIYLVNRQRILKGTQAQMELEQRFLRSQLNPHFISNALLAVQNFMLKKQPEEAAVYLSKFSKLMRETLENSRQEFILLEDELQMLTNFMDIHKMRMNDSFDYQVHMADNIDPESDTIPPMFVQPFVENAIEHGISDAKGRGQIDLHFEKEGEYISIVVKDNGGGFAKSRSNSEGHISLSSTIIQERMDIFNKTLKRKIKLILGNIEGEGGEIQGSKVELKVPFSYI